VWIRSLLAGLTLRGVADLLRAHPPGGAEALLV